MCKRITPLAIIALALLICIPAFAQRFLGAFSGTALQVDTQIETPAQNNNAKTLPEQQAGDTIRFQLFAPAGGGHSTNGYTVELDLPSKTFSSYIGTVSGRNWTGSALTSTGSATLSALLLTGGTVPSTGYLGHIDLQVTQPLEEGATLIVKSFVMTSGNDVDQLDVSNAMITFTATSACPGDFDDNGRVDIADFLSFVNVFGSSSSDATYNAQMDLDSSGSVDIADFLSFVNVFGTECGGTPPPITGNQDSVFTLPGGASLEMVWIEPGTFQMGSPDSEQGRDSDEGPVHSVTISEGFYLGKYEVTQGQWESVMGTRPWQGENNVRLGSNYPAVYVSWEDVQEFIRRLNGSGGSDVYRLPTEAEWEYACRAGTRTRWSFGDDESQLGDYAWYGRNASDVGERYGHIVGTKRANPWGLYDMHGNVWERVQDWFDGNYYRSSPSVDPQGPATGSRRVVRGGHFNSSPQRVRSAVRVGDLPSYRTPSAGFRLALDMGGVNDDRGEGATTVVIPDANLRAVIADSLGKASGEEITAAEMATLTRLDADSKDIRDLTGLEYATNLDSLTLDYNDISDISALSNLTKLRNLSFTYNDISDISALSNLTNLERLIFHVNNVSDISALSNLTSLDWLDVSLNDISDISTLSNLTNLSSLNFGGRRANPHNISDISALSNLTKLRRLEFKYCNVSDISPLSNLTNLATLTCIRNSISDISPLSNLTNLTYIWISNNSISDISPLSNLTNLGLLIIYNNNISNLAPLVANTGLGNNNSVDVRGNPLSALSRNTHIPTLQARGVNVRFDAPSTPTTSVSIPDANLRAVIADSLGKASGEAITAAEMATLTRLDAPNKDIRDLTGLEFATNLTRLDLGTEFVSGSGVVNSNSISDFSSLSNLTSLTWLDIGNTSISDVSWLSSLTNLEWLTLSYNSISDVSALSSLTNLRWLHLSDNSISDVSALVSALSNLTSLISLSLGGNPISDFSPLSNWTSLERLSLIGSSISDVSWLSSLTNLEWLTLSYNSISDLSALSNLTNLETLWLRSNNNISDISALSGLTSLEWLTLDNNNISDLTPLSGLTSLRLLYLGNNSISNLAPLVANTGLSSGDRVDVQRNPLSATSINTHIPALQARGVEVRFGSSKPTVGENDDLRDMPVSSREEALDRAEWEREMRGKIFER